MSASGCTELTVFWAYAGFGAMIMMMLFGLASVIYAVSCFPADKDRTTP